MRGPKAKICRRCTLLFRICASLIAISLHASAWVQPELFVGRHRLATKSLRRFRYLCPNVVPGADIEQPPLEDGAIAPAESRSETKVSATVAGTVSSATSSDSLVAAGRGKVNEIDFCIAPADVSLSRAYGIATTATSTSSNTDASPPVLSLTRALNNASNRAVRRILLARSWPSAEALNLSLRRVAEAEKEREAARLAGLLASSTSSAAMTDSNSPKCPVPRPILNVLMRKQQQNADGVMVGITSNKERPTPRSRTDEEYIADQMKAFRERYGSLSGYSFAEDYLELILRLATAGVESPRADAVLKAGVYDESYKRVLSVLRSGGVALEPDPSNVGRYRIAAKLVDQDICLSVMDKLRIKQSHSMQGPTTIKSSLTGSDNTPTSVATHTRTSETATNSSKLQFPEDEQVVRKDDKKKRRNRFWTKVESDKKPPTDDAIIDNEDLGGVLLSSTEPSMTRQLNVLSNIVQRALLFGGNEELLVLAETLDVDRAAFIERWYPGTRPPLSHDVSLDEVEIRPGVQFFNCLVRLLQDCYEKGVIVDLDPPLPLSRSYANAYERLMASALELGSGYVKPVLTNLLATSKPRTAQEELGRFALWESSFRQSAKASEISSYPDDLVGTWEVRDEIGGEMIGTSSVVFNEGGVVEVNPPLEGLRWRLDPGPTHLDTCTFQVLSSDGTILQYRGFIDRGARLEARFSQRAMKIRGSVMFQMRNGPISYYKDILPINYRTGTTKFVMTKR